MSSDATEPVEALNTVPIEPLTLVCRICKQAETATNTVEVMRHIIEKHPNAMMAASGAFGLLANSYLFEAPENPARWKRNQALFQAEGEAVLSKMIEQGLPSVQDFIAASAGMEPVKFPPPRGAGVPGATGFGGQAPPAARPSRHRERAGSHNRSKPPGANETGY